MSADLTPAPTLGDIIGDAMQRLERARAVLAEEGDEPEAFYEAHSAASELDLALLTWFHVGRARAASAPTDPGLPF